MQCWNGAKSKQITIYSERTWIQYLEKLGPKSTPGMRVCSIIRTLCNSYAGVPEAYKIL